MAIEREMIQIVLNVHRNDLSYISMYFFWSSFISRIKTLENVYNECCHIIWFLQELQADILLNQFINCTASNVDSDGPEVFGSKN
jgi:hypothetical protein